MLCMVYPALWLSSSEKKIGYGDVNLSVYQSLSFYETKIVEFFSQTDSSVTINQRKGERTHDLVKVSVVS